MACQVVSNFEEVLTPSRKRKRDLEPGCNGLANEGFSSTPKKESKLLIGSLHQFSRNRNNRDTNPFTNGTCFEVKSIADIVDGKRSDDTENPYEVARKPPKKKKKADVEVACFENPALNLEGPETRFNPFEVKRSIPAKKDDNCFINSALNIKSPENAAVNPYEIIRCTNPPETTVEGIENPALEEPSSFRIALPFIPTVGCRIDFNNISLNSLTPSKLLAEKLVFSPTTKGTTAYKHFRRSLSVISEETLDIGKELDCYQLELENSINEAKLKKNVRKAGAMPTELHLIHETESIDLSINITSENISRESNSTETEISTSDCAEVHIPPTIDEDPAEDSFEDDFKTPAPFVRCYRKSQPLQPNAPVNKSTSSDKSNPHGDNNKHKVADMIRKSFRKLIPSHSEKEKTETGTTNFINTIRHSLRRRNKNNAKPSGFELIANDNNFRDISILDTAEQRKIFKFVAESDESERHHEAEGGAKSSFRRSLRRSTRDVRNQVLKTVFNKNVEEYKMKR